MIFNSIYLAYAMQLLATPGNRWELTQHKFIIKITTGNFSQVIVSSSLSSYRDNEDDTDAYYEDLEILWFISVILY